MRNDQPVYIITDEKNAIMFVDESFVNLQRQLGVGDILPAKDTLAKLRAGLNVSFEKDGYKYNLVRWDLKTGELHKKESQKKTA